MSKDESFWSRACDLRDISTTLGEGTGDVDEAKELSVLIGSRLSG